jgi:hypothetical protein
MPDYIKMDALIPYGLYKIEARNASYGIWLPMEAGFAISRIKFGDNFIFVEYHWDCPSFATAKPINLIEQSPFIGKDFDYVEKTNSRGEMYHDWRKHHEVIEYLNRFEGTIEERTDQGRR